MAKIVGRIAIVLLSAGACAACSGTNGGEGDAATPSDTEEFTSPLDTDSWPRELPDGGVEADEPECSHLGEWEWTEIPVGADCGFGCTQLTFSEEYLEYDMWDVSERYAVYKPHSGAIHVIDLQEMRDLEVPPPVEGVVYEDYDAWAHYPTVYEDEIVYGFKLYEGWPEFKALYLVDATNLCQTALYVDEAQQGEHQEPFYYGDLRGSLYVASTNIDGIFSDDVNDWYNTPFDIAAFDLRFPFAGMSALVEDLPQFGFAAPQLAEDDVVWMWFSETGPWMDIVRYDMVTHETSALDTGAEWMSNMAVWEDSVVYTVMPNASGWTPEYGFDDWSGADIWLYDLGADTVENLTDDEFVQVEPDIQGRRVAYFDYSASSDPLGPHPLDGGDIYVLDLDAGVTTRASFLPDRYKGMVELSGDRVFFIMFDELGLEQLYMIDLDAVGA